MSVVPDGYIELTLKEWPWDDAPADGKLRIDFQDIKWWRREITGIVVAYRTKPEEFMHIPWCNIAATEWKCNTDEVARAIHLEQCSGKDCIHRAHREA